MYRKIYSHANSIRVLMIPIVGVGKDLKREAHNIW